MKITINNYPSTSPDKLVVTDPEHREVFDVTEHCADDSVFKFSISRVDLEAAPKLEWPEPTPLITVPTDSSAVARHWWMTNGLADRMLAF
jgi:hypothetical protein